MKLGYTATLFLLLGATAVFAQPSNDDCAKPFAIPPSANWCSSIAQFTNVGATPSGYGAASCFGNASNDVWFTFTPVATDVRITVIGNTQQGPGGTLTRPEIGLYLGTCGGTINEQECESDAAGNNVIELYKGGLAIGETYYIRIQGRGGRTGTFQLCINNYNPPAQPGSDCVIASLLCDKNSFAVQKVTGAGNDPREANDADCLNSFAGNVESNSTWFSWTAATNGSLTFTLKPLNPSDDLDFVLYELPQGALDCRNKRVIRCMASGDFSYPSRCMGPTGLRDGSSDNSEPAGCADPRQDNFLAPVQMVAGRSYTLMVNNFSATGNGFSIEFGGTGEFQGPVADFTMSDPDSTICVGEPITFTDASNFGLGNLSEYHWSFGPTASIASSDQKGPQTVTFNKAGTKSIVLTVTSDKGCVVTKIKTIRVVCCPDHFSSANGAVTNLTCPNANDGAVDLSIATNYPPYTFLWNDSTMTEDLSNLMPGTYTVTVTDQATCDTTLTFNVTGPPPLNFDIQTVKPTCGGGQDGAATVNVTGGTPPYQYNWQNQGFTSNNTLPNIPRGDYTVIVRDANNCDTTLTIPVRELELILDPNVQAVTPPLCNGGSDGSIQVAVTNGKAPFQYDWQDGRGFQSANSLVGLRAGTYRVDVQDANLCIGSFDFVMEDHPPLQITFDSTNASCNGVPDGSAKAIPTGGVGNYTFAWSNGQTSDTIKSLAKGNYTVTVTDANKCTVSNTVFIAEPAPVLVNVVETKDVTCNGDTTGVITVMGNGGTQPYEYSLDGSIFQGSETFTRLKAGNYTITIEDAEGCTNTTTAVIQQPPALIVDAGPDTTIDLGTSVHLQAIANNAKVVWQWAPTDQLSCADCPNPTASPFTTTKYLVTIKNEADCDASDEITIIVNKVRPIYIPNAFSPNEDGVNDRFTIFGGAAAEVITTLRVFDRWGNLLFEGTNLPLNQENVGWNGLFKGKPMGTGVYTYMAEVRFIDGEVILYEGDISIVR